MSNISVSANLRFLLNGQAVNAPIEWQDIEILANFDNDSIQANITTESFTFVNEARQAILAYIEAGKNGGFGIFEGLPFKIEALSTSSALVVFDGLIDLSNGFKDFPDRGRCECRLLKSDGMNSFEERLEAITYGFLKEKGFISASDYIDVDYVVIKPNQAQDIAIASIVTYLLIKEIREQIREISRDVATASGIFSAGITGSVGSAIFTIASIIFQVAYTAAMILAVANMVATIVNALYPIRRKHKAIRLKRLLEAACSYAGFGFETDIKELDYYTYLPSNPNFDEAGPLSALTVGNILEGIPNSQDYGYRVIEILELAKKLFKAKFAVVNSVVQFRWAGTYYWTKTANYTLPSVLLEQYRYNTEEMKANLVLSFATDPLDEWTLKNFTGTNYQVATDLIATNGATSNFAKGLEEVVFPVCLGNRKDKSTILEKLIEALNNFKRQIEGIFGRRAPAIGAFSSNGLLKVSSNNHSRPKLLYISRNGMPANHRDLLSAKYLYQNFHIYDSFVANNFQGQKIVYEGVRVPFGLQDFLKLVENSYFSNGAKAIKVSWRLGSDYAVVDYWQRQVYTRNLQQTFIEP